MVSVAAIPKGNKTRAFTKNSGTKVKQYDKPKVTGKNGQYVSKRSTQTVNGEKVEKRQITDSNGNITKQHQDVNGNWKDSLAAGKYVDGPYKGKTPTEAKELKQKAAEAKAAKSTTEGGKPESEGVMGWISDHKMDTAMLALMAAPLVMPLISGGTDHKA